VFAPMRVARPAGRSDAFWVYLLFFSFAYDRPVFALFGLLRVDPRPFDLVFCGFMLYALSNSAALKQRLATDWFMKRPLRLILGWAAIVVAFQFLWIPWEYQLFSLFYLIRYVQLYLAVWLVATSALSDDQRGRAIRVFLLTVIFVAAYGVMQYMGKISVVQYRSDGSILKMTGTQAADLQVRISSTLGYHYAYFGSYCVLGVILAFLVILGEKRVRGTTVFLVGAIVSGLCGMVLSQSLSAHGTLFLAGALAVWNSIKTSGRQMVRYATLLVFIVLAGFVVLKYAPSSVTARFYGMWDKTFSEESGAVAYDTENPIQRLSGTADYLPYYLSNSEPIELLFGRGFYVARGIGDERRIGYGIHNSIVFMLEQLGPVGFFLGLNLIWVFIVTPWRQMHRPSSEHFLRVCGQVVFAWALALIIAGLSGQIFWVFEALGSWFTIVLCIWSLLIRPVPRDASARTGLNASATREHGFPVAPALRGGR